MHKPTTESKAGITKDAEQVHAPNMRHNRTATETTTSHLSANQPIITPPPQNKSGSSSHHLTILNSLILRGNLRLHSQMCYSAGSGTPDTAEYDISQTALVVSKSLVATALGKSVNLLLAGVSHVTGAQIGAELASWWNTVVPTRTSPRHLHRLLLWYLHRLLLWHLHRLLLLSVFAVFALLPTLALLQQHGSFWRL